MKKKSVQIGLMLLIAFSVVRAQTNSINLPLQWIELMENQKTPLLTSDEEVIMIDGTAWQRCYGEKEYVLTPRVKNIQKYQAHIKQLTDKITFHYAKVKLTELSKSILKQANIDVPNYVVEEVNVLLPEIDINALQSAGINVNYLIKYGTQIKSNLPLSNKNQSTSAIIFNEDFENATIPGAVYSTTLNGATNCGWKDVSCYKHAGSWSVWCAGNGAGCNPCLGDYINNMDAEFWKTNTINTSSYQNLVITWWMDYDFNNTGTNDILTKYWWLSGAWQLSAVSYNSSSPFDGLLWNQHTASFPGIQTDFGYDFRFVSNSLGTQFGVYIDDIQLTGTPVATSLIQQSNQLIRLNIFPNPNNGQFIVSTEADIVIKITNELGQIVKSFALTAKNNHRIEISELSAGIYFITGNVDNKYIREKIIVTK